jgi:uncharacterized protein YoxC
MTTREPNTPEGSEGGDEEARVREDEAPPAGEISGAIAFQELSEAFRASARRWEMVVYPSLVAFLILAVYGFYLIYSLTQDAHAISQHMYKVSQRMEVVSDRMKTVSSNFELVATRMDDVSGDMKKVAADIRTQSVAIGQMNSELKQMNKSVGRMQRSVNQIQYHFGYLNRNVSQPMGNMGDFMP